MGRPALGSEAIAGFRDRVCDVALRQFADDGYRAVTLRGIARALGRSHAMTYRYFTSKDDVLVAVRRRGLDCFTEFQRARLEPIDDPAEAIREGARSYVDFAVAEPHVFRVLFDLEQPALAANPALRDAHRGAFRVLETVIRRGVAAGVVAGDPAEVTRLLWASVHGIASLHLAGQLAGKRTAQAMAVHMAETLLVGLAPTRNR